MTAILRCHNSIKVSSLLAEQVVQPLIILIICHETECEFLFCLLDEKAFQTFAVYCGLALHHAKVG